ncbi:DUF4236 domain-containing protein [Bradyrhizobium sp. SRL28]|uniref:DUF4236 domain-containing protein n=1 Tax=Bradyrhizobium sp. SRL28 TaxID=2836178 RepID=UPI001BDF07AB|nr:DUF4236 domain-containing protein [Bradyrhizobium sp. SRL28]MBT1511779.1 DUF4236 domain-containing protein [Bradyrhizobium sp. SRL28]
MGFRFRRSFKIIPGVRLNLSGGGASVSLGPRGLRYTIGSRGTRTTIGLPGSGLSWTAYKPYGSAGSSQPPNRPAQYEAEVEAPEPVIIEAGGTVIDSAPIEQLLANSTIDIATALNASLGRWHSYKMWLIFLSAIFSLVALVVIASATSVPPAAAFLGAAGAVIILGSIWLHGRESSAISLDYDLSAEELGQFEALARAFDALAHSSNVWRIPLEKQEADWKRNAGAAKLVERKSISLTRGNPPLVRSNLEFLQLPLGKETVYLTPDAVLVMMGDDVAGLSYADIQFDYRQSRFIEDGTPPSDAMVVGETWQYLNRKGGPDRRFKNNRQLPICLYGEIDIRSAGGLNERIHSSRVEAAEEFASAAAAICAPGIAAASNALLSSPIPLRDIASDQYQGSESVGDVRAAYAHETDLALTLALNHGECWEFLLVEELLRSKLQLLKNDCENLGSIVPAKLFTGREFVTWVGDECTNLSPAIAEMATCIEKDLVHALAEPGVSGDAVQLLGAVNTIFFNCRKFLNFEKALNAAEVTSAFYDLKLSFRGITGSVVHVVEDLQNQWSRNTAALRNGAKSFEVKISFETPPQALIALKEIEKIKKRPGLL